MSMTSPIVDTVDVSMAFQLVQILDVNEKAQTIKTIVWLTYVSNVFLRHVSVDFDFEFRMRTLEFFSKWSRTFIEFSEFSESDKSLKYLKILSCK